MRRYLSIYFPEWHIDSTRKRSKGLALPEPLVLTGTIRGQEVVRRCSDSAKRSGIEEELSLALAKALNPAISAQPFEPEQDFKLLYKLAVWSLRFTPLVAIDKELIAAYKSGSLAHAPESFNGLMLDISGTERLHGSELLLAQKLILKLRKAKFIAQIGIASTVGAAWALARFGEYAATEVVQVMKGGVGQIEVAIAPKSYGSLRATLEFLPIYSLRLSEVICEQLAEHGICSVGELLAFPRKKLLTRFGNALIRRIDQALGHGEEALHLIHPSTHIVAERNFDVPISRLPAVQSVVLSLLAEVFQKLATRDKRASTFILTIQGQDPRQPLEQAAFLIRKVFSLQNATENLKHIGTVMQPLLDSLVLPEGIISIAIAVRGCEQRSREQTSVFENSAISISKQEQGEFMNSLALGVGDASIHRLRFQQSYLPERSFELYPVHKEKDIEVALPCALQRSFACPPHLLDTPQQISAISLLPDSPPTQITWRGDRYRIEKGIGPERIGAEWWQEKISGVHEREYFRVQDHTGRWLWVFRTAPQQEWFVHGMWC